MSNFPCLPSFYLLQKLSEITFIFFSQYPASNEEWMWLKDNVKILLLRKVSWYFLTSKFEYEEKGSLASLQFESEYGENPSTGDRWRIFDLFRFCFRWKTPFPFVGLIVLIWNTFSLCRTHFLYLSTSASSRP